MRTRLLLNDFLTFKGLVIGFVLSQGYEHLSTGTVLYWVSYLCDDVEFFERASGAQSHLFSFSSN